MCIIDRYLLRKFTQTFLICFLSLTGLYIVFDVFTNLDHFVRCGQKTGGVLHFIYQYYCHRWILVFDRTSSILAMISAMFTVAWIQRHNEMTALLAAGVPRIRVITPIIAAVAAVSLLSVVNRETLIPRYRSELARRPQDPLGDQPQSITPRQDNRTDVVLGGKNSYADCKRIEAPNFLLRDPALQLYGKQLTAENAYYMPAEGNRPAGYLFDDVHEPRNLDTRASLFLNGQAVLITPHDAPDWLKPNQCFLCSDMDFDQLAGGEEYARLASTWQLIAGLRNPSLGYGAEMRTAIHVRIVQPLLDMTLLFLGLPLIVNRESRNVFWAMIVCGVVTVSFTLVSAGLQQLGGISYLLNPALAAWAPLMIFVPLSVWLAESLWK